MDSTRRLVSFLNGSATIDIYTLSLHDALPIFGRDILMVKGFDRDRNVMLLSVPRSEEHTSELQSLRQLVCRLVLEKKKIPKVTSTIYTNRQVGVYASMNPQAEQTRQAIKVSKV